MGVLPKQALVICFYTAESPIKLLRHFECLKNASSLLYAQDLIVQCSNATPHNPYSLFSSSTVSLTCRSHPFHLNSHVVYSFSHASLLSSLSHSLPPFDVLPICPSDFPFIVISTFWLQLSLSPSPHCTGWWLCCITSFIRKRCRIIISPILLHESH